LAQTAYREGDTNGLSLMRKVEEFLRTESAFSFDYAQIVDETTLDLITGEISRPARLLLAGYMGSAPRIRLIDNDTVNR
jgi:pantothenate synthetase